MARRTDAPGAQARAAVLAFLAGRDWTGSSEILDAVDSTDMLARSHGVAAINQLFNAGTLLRSGKPPRGCVYKLSSDENAPAPSEREPLTVAPNRPALEYVAPAIVPGPLVPALGLRVVARVAEEQVA